MKGAPCQSKDEPVREEDWNGSLCKGMGNGRKEELAGGSYDGLDIILLGPGGAGPLPMKLISEGCSLNESILGGGAKSLAHIAMPASLIRSMEFGYCASGVKRDVANGLEGRGAQELLCNGLPNNGGTKEFVCGDGA